MSVYYTMVTLLNISYLRFFAVSITVHVVFFFLLNSRPPLRVNQPETIPISVMDAPPRRETVPGPAPSAARTPAADSAAIIAKKDSPRLTAKTQLPKDRSRAARETRARAETAPAKPQSGLPAPPAREAVPERSILAERRTEPPPQASPAPPAREVVPEQSIIAERPLPTLKDLLPSVSWSSDSRATAPISLNTRDPVYVSYFTKIKQMINAQWEYPELALRYGLEGKLSVEFIIGANGQLERLRLLRSSGSQVLDEEALRAIKAAAPFPPIPRWIGQSPLTILGEMIYDDNRVNYQLVR